TDVSAVAQQAAETSAAEISRSPSAASDILTRKYENLLQRYPSLSLAMIAYPPVAPAPQPGTTAPPAPSAASRLVTAGPWRHGAPPTELPAWLASSAGG